jgi:hypothetical protein
MNMTSWSENKTTVQMECDRITSFEKQAKDRNAVRLSRDGKEILWWDDEFKTKVGFIGKKYQEMLKSLSENDISNVKLVLLDPTMNNFESNLWALQLWYIRDRNWRKRRIYCWKFGHKRKWFGGDWHESNMRKLLPKEEQHSIWNSDISLSMCDKSRKAPEIYENQRSKAKESYLSWQVCFQVIEWKIWKETINEIRDRIWERGFVESGNVRTNERAKEFFIWQ